MAVSEATAVDRKGWYNPWLIAAAITCWILGALLSVTLLFEYPGSVSSVLWRTYPGLFQWPVVFFPLCCFFLLRPLTFTWSFLIRLGARGRLFRLLFGAMIAITVIGMSAYEWNNNKPAVWELSPSISAQPARLSIPAAFQHEPAVMAPGSFDGLARAIRNRGPAEDRIPQCRFSGVNRPEYRASTCFCAPARQATTGATCEHVRAIWFQALATEIAKPGQKSLTYYTTRLSFSIMALIFITGLATVLFMSSFAKEMERDSPHAFRLSRTFIQIFATLCAIWFVQRLYFIYEQATIFPSDDGPTFISSAYSALMGLFILLGVLLAFALRVDALRKFYESLLAPLLAIASAILGVAQPQLFADAFRGIFGVDATPFTLIAFIALVIVVALFPLVSWLKERMMPDATPSPAPVAKKRGRSGRRKS